jgi:hypothetical protein
MERVNPLDQDFTDGCIYQYFVCLDSSENAYTFSLECSDGEFYFSTSTFTGPFVYAEEPPDGTQGLDNLNSTNIFAITMTIGISIGIVTPFIVITEVKVRKIKSVGKSSPKINKKGIKS